MNIFVLYLVFTGGLLVANMAGLFVTLCILRRIYRYFPKCMMWHNEFGVSLFVAGMQAVWIVSAYSLLGYVLDYPPVVSAWL